MTYKVNHILLVDVADVNADWPDEGFAKRITAIFITFVVAISALGSWIVWNVMKKAEYKEGPEARENFERLAKAVFQAPKIKAGEPPKPTPRKKSGKKRG
jgi:hypothetical protein